MPICIRILFTGIDCWLCEAIVLLVCGCFSSDHGPWKFYLFLWIVLTAFVISCFSGCYSTLSNKDITCYDQVPFNVA